MKPLLSIGIIFKNEIRCLERCVKSLQALRDAVSCELIMADTGSDDGSRETAERYADLLLDVPWTDDFSAARNAVMDRCSGEWYLSLDADEWLDENIDGLLAFFRDRQRSEPTCGLTVRNYISPVEHNLYTDFLAIRMVRMSSGLRYVGRIHERWEFPDGRELLVYPLGGVVLHHDGYVMLNDGSAAGKEKLERNMRLLQRELLESPGDLRLLIQCIESCGLDYESQLPYIRQGMELILKRQEGWAETGANFLHYAVHAAHKLDLPELGEWIALAETLFPDSIYTTVEVQFDAAEHAWRNMDCPEIIYRGLRYIKGAQDYRAGRVNANDLLQSPLLSASFHHETTLRAFVARVQAYEGQPEAALETLETLDYDTMDEEQAAALLDTMLRIHTLSLADTAPLLLKFWTKINAPKPSQEAADRRRARLTALAAAQFAPDCVRGERARMNGDVSLDGIGRVRAEEWNVLSRLRPCRYGYTLFRPLQGQTEIGTAAALMDETAPEAAVRLLEGVKRLEELPIAALSRALVRGVPFPLPDRPMNIEEMDALAARLAQDKEALRTLAERAAAGDFTGNWQTLLWTRGLVLAAVRTCQWNDKTRDLALAKSFARVERDFLSACYAPRVLREEAVCALPVMHRSGWYCARAFAALEAGDSAAYTRYLREGLISCEGMKDMVEFLMEHTPELQAPPPGAELLALAEKVRTILAAYPADDPAVAALKVSPAYRKVANLIEGDNA
jgi:hypothetical protein|nr:glycosyltransferase [uncultured Oscillibacter sp.]